MIAKDQREIHQSNQKRYQMKFKSKYYLPAALIILIENQDQMKNHLDK